MKLRVYNKTLEPNIWNENQTLKPGIREALLKVAEEFYNSTELEGEIHNILFIGSSANYNWNPQSDIDVHIVIDIAQEKINEEYARKFMDSLAFKWNIEHDVEIKGHPVEVYLQDIREPNSTVELARKNVAIYSLFDDKWLLKPHPQKIQIDADKIRKKFQQLQKRIEDLIQTEDIKKLKTLMKYIRNYRNAGMTKGGEFSTENLVFKSLRKSDELEKMKNAINTIYDKKASLPEEGNIPSYKKTKPLNEKETKPFLLVGMIWNDLKIKSVKDYKGDGGSVTHERLGMYNGIRWRYNSKLNELYWSKDEEEITDDQKDEVLSYLYMKYNVINPKQKYEDVSWFKGGHYLNEIIDKNSNLYLGYVNKDIYKVVGTSVPNNQFGHDDFPIPYNWDGDKCISWRYKKDKNMIYWWPPEGNEKDIDENTKEAVEHWLKENLNITNKVSHGFIKTGNKCNHYNFMDAHCIYENKLQNGSIILGCIDSYLEISGVKIIISSNDMMDNNHTCNGLRWRYKYPYNILFWWDHPSEKQKDTVMDFLKDKFNIDIKKHSVSVTDDQFRFLHTYKDSPQNFSEEKQELKEIMSIIESSLRYNCIRNIKEEKFDPFKAKKLEFVTYGGLSLVKQKGYNPEKENDESYHSPPTRRGIYAFVWPYIEKFLLGGDVYTDPKKRGKGVRLRTQYVKDKEGNKIDSDHPDFEKESEKNKNWSFSREIPKDNQPTDQEIEDNGGLPRSSFFKDFLYKSSNRKKFKYDGTLWSHLGKYVKDFEIIDKKGSWVKTDMNVFKRALQQDFKERLKDNKNNNFNVSGFGTSNNSYDELEVFIDTKI